MKTPEASFPLVYWQPSKLLVYKELNTKKIAQDTYKICLDNYYIYNEKRLQALFIVLRAAALVWWHQ